MSAWSPGAAAADEFDMNGALLACGPYFSETGLLATAVIFLLIKPLAYYGFIMAFRYRVCRPIPMRRRRAAGLALLRTGLGVISLGGGAGLMYALDGRSESILLWSWGYLYAARLLEWWAVGWWGAALRGRRLAGWVVSGTLINAAFDGAVLIGLMEGWVGPALITGAVAAFIAVLDVVGRRPSLRARIAASGVCRGCRYDLTGNLSGRCPECGVVVNFA